MIGVLFLAALIVFLVGLAISNPDIDFMRPSEWDRGTTAMAISFIAMLVIAVWGVVHLLTHNYWT